MDLNKKRQKFENSIIMKFFVFVALLNIKL